MEFSKQVVVRCLWIFGTHVLTTLAVIFFSPQSAEAVVALMRSVTTVYVAVFIGYFGKSGAENYQKIKTSISAMDEEGQG